MVGKQTATVKPSPPEVLNPTSTSNIKLEDFDDRPNKKARRTFLTQHACTRCRSKKSKCDGKRPTCARCEKHGVECVYDVAQEGITRMQNLQNQLRSTTEEKEKLDKLFTAMQTGTDQAAAELLARLKMGDTIDDLLSYIGESQPSASGQQPQQSPTEEQQTPGYLQRWPSTQDGYWTTPSEPSSRNPSLTSINQPAGSGEVRHSQSDSILPLRDGYRQPEGQAGFYPSRSSHSMPQQGQNVAFETVQWQSQERTENASPYYTDPSSGQMQPGQRPREQ